MNNRFTSALFILFALLLATCEKPERNNPWDEKADPSAWAPKNLRISKISDYALKLEWDYNIKTHEGFRIERSVDNGSWEMLDSNLVLVVILMMALIWLIMTTFIEFMLILINAIQTMRKLNTYLQLVNSTKVG